MKKKLLSMFMLCVTAFSATHATTYYAGTPLGGTRDNTKPAGKHPLNPYASLQSGVNALAAGDTLFVMGGTYTPTTNYTPLMRINKAGIAGDPIVIQNYPGHTPILQAPTEGVWNLVKIHASESTPTVIPSYIVIDGLTLRGNSSYISPTDPAVETQPGSHNNPCSTPGCELPKFNGQGILVTGPFAWDSDIDGLPQYAIPHHITIQNCKAYEFPSSGISMQRADEITVQNCEIYNNCYYTIFGTTGLNFYQAVLFDQGATLNSANYRVKFLRNKIYGNDLKVLNQKLGARYDGNGIIIDNFNHDQDGGNGTGSYIYPAYQGKTLIANNVVYNNGGAGFKVFTSDFIDIYNNSFYNNNANPYANNSDICIEVTGTVNVKNNIASGPKEYISSGTNVTLTNNIFKNGTGLSGVNCTNCLIGDPLFVSPGVTGSANFELQSGSPAINNGTNLTPVTVDFKNVNRSLYAITDIGAYEFASNPLNIGSTGYTNNALRFDGVDDYVATSPVNAFNNIGTGNFTIEARINASSTNTKSYPAIVSNRPSNSGIILFINTGSDPSASGKLWANINGINYPCSNSPKLTDDACHHVALTREGSTLKFYIDGTLNTSRPVDPYVQASLSSTAGIRIGHDYGNSSETNFKGDISEVRLWSYARSATEIANNQFKSLSGGESNLVGYWRLNEGTGQTAYSSIYTATTQHGTLGSTGSADGNDPAWVSSCASLGKRYGASFENPIKLGILKQGANYNSTINNASGNGYDNDFGKPSEDIVYSFTIDAPSLVTIDHCPTDDALDTYLTLLNSAKVELTLADDNGPICSGVNASMQFNLSAGTYYIVSESYYATSTGNITTHISVSAATGSPTWRAASVDVEDNDKTEPSNSLSQEIESNVIAYPNPLQSGNLNFGRTVSKFALFDSTGSMVSEGENVDKLNADQLQKGIYFLNIEGKTQKIVVQ